MWRPQCTIKLKQTALSQQRDEPHLEKQLSYQRLSYCLPTQQLLQKEILLLFHPPCFAFASLPPPVPLAPPQRMYLPGCANLSTPENLHYS